MYNINPYFVILLISMAMFAGALLGYTIGQMRERTAWNLKLAEKGILPSNWNRVKVGS